MATRAERKAKRKQLFDQLYAAKMDKLLREEQLKRERAAWASRHPVSAGIIPLTTYQEPHWGYSR